jgi:RND family efflux transporter MFP subunit
MTVAAGCGQRAHSGPQAGDTAPPAVTVGKPVARQITDYFEFPGQAAAVGEVDVRARVTGYLTKVNFEDGQNVKRGDLLYEIDPRPYEAALDRARAELDRLYALLEKAKADVARSERLRPSGAVSQDEYELHKANLKVHSASIQAARAAVRDAELNLEFTKIASPIDGRVSRTRITKGNLVQPGTNDSVVLTTVVTRNPIYVYFCVDEQALLKYQELALRKGQQLHPKRLKDLKIPLEIGLLGEREFSHAGVVDFADNKLDRTTGTLRVRGEFENNNEYLTPGQYVRVRIPFGDPHQALFAPERAIQRDQAAKYLLVVIKVKDKDIVEYRKVQVGTLRDGLREIVTGVGPDDWIVVEGLQFAIPGKSVTPDRQASPPAGKVAGASKHPGDVKN